MPQVNGELDTQNFMKFDEVRQEPGFAISVLFIILTKKIVSFTL